MIYHRPHATSVAKQAWLPGRAVVEESLRQRYDVDASGEIVKLISYCPWKEHIYDLEEELQISPLIKFCLYEVQLCRVDDSIAI